MIFVEILRLIVVLIGATVGLAVGSSLHTETARLLGAVIGVLVGYVAGGTGGRFLAREVKRADRPLLEVPALEVLAGALLGGLGFLLGVVVSLPLFFFVRRAFDYPIAAGIAWVLGAIGLKLGRSNAERLAQAARITRQLSVLQEVPEGSVLVDTSAVMDRSFLVLGRAGLLGGEVLLPEPVADELATLAAGPDPVASRRARRGLEAVAAIQEAGVKVTVLKGDVVEAALTEEKVLRLASSLGVRLYTCSGALARANEQAEVPIIDLRALVADLAPDHVPGERLLVDLVRPGRQERQAIGYLPDGDMVVVNDAEHLLGEDSVEVTVLSTRPTPQGMLVFAALADARQAKPGAP
jgi:uncharacterized protein YacL